MIFFLEDVCAFFIRTCGHKLGRLPAWHPVVSNTGRNLSLTLCQSLSLAKSLLGTPPGVARAGWRLGRLHRASETPSDSEELCRDSQPSARTCVQASPSALLKAQVWAPAGAWIWESLHAPAHSDPHRRPSPTLSTAGPWEGRSARAPPYRLPADLHCEEPGRPAAPSWGRPSPKAPSSHRSDLSDDAWEVRILRSP